VLSYRLKIASNPILMCMALLCVCIWGCTRAQTAGNITVNPVIPADVPDPSVIRAGDVYYMSSTTMHMNPGIPVMKSTDLVNWSIVNYVYATIGDSDEHTLSNGKNEYGRGTWASSLRHHNGLFYVVSFSYTTRNTYVFRTADIETGSWERFTLDGVFHDPSLFFDENRAFLVYGVDTIRITELSEDATSLKEGGVDGILIPDAKNIAGTEFYVPAEGAHIQKINGYYYVSLISWPAGGMRTQLVYRADSLFGDYTGKIVLQDEGVAQGGFIDTPDGDWYAFLFKDSGAVGRVPVLVPLRWEDNWPVLGVDGKVPQNLSSVVPAAGNTPASISASHGMQTGLAIPGIVASDEFDGTLASGRYNDATSILAGLPLVWQWNHNPDPDYWSLHERQGYLRLTNRGPDSGFTQTRNTLTQRTFGPQCTGTVKMDVSGMKNGDVAGLGALQGTYGFVGVKMENGKRYVVKVKVKVEVEVEKGDGDEVKVEVEVESEGVDLGEERVQEYGMEHDQKNDADASADEDRQMTGVTKRETGRIPFDSDVVYLRTAFDFTDQADLAYFYYSLNGELWEEIGEPLQMRYTLDHFMGYRFALFSYATEQAGGQVDFDYFRVMPGLPD
jgi:beta-xylosidase